MKIRIIKAAILLAAVAIAVPSAPAFAQRGQGQGQHLRGGQQHVRHHGGHQRARHHHRGHRHHGHNHAHFGFFFGAPLAWAPWYYPPSYYYYPPAVAVPSSPTVYVEKDRSAAPGDDTQYWYYCRESETYYPYVKQCAGPWEKVLPYTPPS